MSNYIKRGKKQVNKLYLIIPIVLVIALAFGGAYYYYQFMITEYDFSNRLSILDVDTRITPIAKNLALPTEDDINVDDISSESIILAGGDGSLIASKVATKRMYPASTTKVMTALVALKYGNLTDEVTVTEDSVINEAGASLAGIHPGDVLTLDQLLYGLMLPSGNDAANAIAIHVGGSVENFVKMMNEEAKRIGAVDTNFVNSNGLSDENHYTTAYDLYLIFNEALKDPRFANYAGCASYNVTYTAADGSQVTKNWRNGNRYITGQVAAPYGVAVEAGKTGTTLAAGSCLVISSANDKGNRYISVVLKSKNRADLYDNMSKLLMKIDK
jgi:hypothetical protein